MLGIEPKGDGANSVSLKFPNGSRIIGLPGSPATVRAFSKLSMLMIVVREVTAHEQLADGAGQHQIW